MTIEGEEDEGCDWHEGEQAVGCAIKMDEISSSLSRMGRMQCGKDKDDADRTS